MKSNKFLTTTLIICLSLLASIVSAEKLTVKVDPKDSGSVKSDPAGIDTKDTQDGTFNKDTEVTLTAKPETGKALDKWDGDASGTEMSVKIKMDKDKSVTAKFGEGKKVSVKVEGAGKVESDPKRLSVAKDASLEEYFIKDSKVTLKATPDSGMKFLGWSGDGVTDENKNKETLEIAKLDKDISVTAKFGKTVKLTVEKDGNGTGKVTSNPAGIDCGSTCSAEFTEGTKVTLTATPDEKMKFAGWTIGTEKKTETTLTVELKQDTTVKATFNKSGCGCSSGTSGSKALNYLLDFIFVGMVVSIFAGMRRSK